MPHNTIATTGNSGMIAGVFLYSKYHMFVNLKVYTSQIINPARITAAIGNAARMRGVSSPNSSLMALPNR